MLNNEKQKFRIENIKIITEKYHEWPNERFSLKKIALRPYRLDRSRNLKEIPHADISRCELGNMTEKKPLTLTIMLTVEIF